MFRNVASKAGLVGLAVVIGAVGLEACSSSDGGTPNTGGTTSHGGTGGTAGATGGTTGTTGGTTGTTGGTTGTTGGTTGTTGGTTGTAGAGGGSATGPFACAGTMASCDAWTTFAQSTTNSWGVGAFTGGVTVFGAGLTRDATTTDSIHVTGMVTGYGYGFGLYFTGCSDLSKYTGVSYKVKGNTGTAGTITFQVQSNADYPFVQAPADKKGACVATDTTNPFGMCGGPTKSSPVTTTETTVTVAWADLGTGLPVATTDGKEVVGIQWSLPWAGATGTPYAADVTVSDVHLTGGTGTSISCASGTGGTGAGGSGGAAAGGAGGASGSGGTGGA